MQNHPHLRHLSFGLALSLSIMMASWMTLLPQSQFVLASENSIAPLGGNACIQIKKNLRKGSKGPDVLVLQTFLFQNGYLKSNPMSTYDSSTSFAVWLFQKANRIGANGNVGLTTRKKIENITCKKSIPTQNKSLTTPNTNTSLIPSILLGGGGSGGGGGTASQTNTTTNSNSSSTGQITTSSSGGTNQTGGTTISGPIISNVGTASIGTTVATIGWNLSEPSTGQVEYGTSSGNLNKLSILEPTYIYARHEQYISSFLPNTLYYYRVVSKNKAGGITKSAVYQFRTLSLTTNTGTISTGSIASTGSIISTGATTPNGPVISSVSAILIGTGNVTFSWNTSVPSTGQVEFGTSSGTLDRTNTLEPTFIYTHHEQYTTGLTPNTTYYYRTMSRNQAGILSKSPIFQFRTLASSTNTGTVVNTGSISTGNSGSIPQDIAIDTLGIASAYAPSPYPNVLGSYVDPVGNTVKRLTDGAHVTTANGYNAVNTPASYLGMNYVYKHLESVDGKYLIVPMVTKAGQSFTWFWDVLDRATYAVVGKLNGQNDAMLSNNPATPLRRYYIGYNGGEFNQLRYDNLPDSSGDTLVTTFVGYNNVQSSGERRQSDGANERTAVIAKRNDGSGSDVLLIDLASGTILKKIEFPGWTVLSGTANDLRFAAVSHDGNSIAVGISLSNGQLSAFPYSMNQGVAIFDCSGIPTLTGRTYDRTSNHGDWVVRPDGQEGFGTHYSPTNSTSDTSLVWFPKNFNPNTDTPLTLLASGPAAAATYLGGMIPGRALVSYGDFSIYGDDAQSVQFNRLIDLRADGSQMGSIRAISQAAVSNIPYEGIMRATFGRTRDRVYINLTDDPITRTNMWISTR